MDPEQQNNKIILNKIIILVVFSLLFILAMIYCKYQQVFTVKQIVVHGQYELNEKEIIQSSGIKRGANMFDLELAEGLERLIAEPYIYNAYISRQFPDIINIHVIERQPVAMIRLKDDYALDAFATMLPAPEKYNTNKIPMITGVDNDLPISLGYPTYHPDIRYAINFVNYVQHFNDDITSYCSHITWSGKKGWIIQKDSDYPKIYLGKTELEKRFDILDAFITKMEADSIDMRKYKYVSLRFNGQVIVRD